MSSSLRIVPPNAYPTHHTTPFSAPSAPGIHDTLRASLNPSLALESSLSSKQHSQIQLQSRHPLESRLTQWRTTQQTLKHTLLRRQFGISAPLIREMELLTVANGDAARPSCLLGPGASAVHEDVLRGTDCDVTWEDVFGGDPTRPISDFHSEMEQRLRMHW